MFNHNGELIVSAVACPNNCLQCTVNSASGAVECDVDRCENGYGLKASDKSCVGKRVYYHVKVARVQTTSKVNDPDSYYSSTAYMSQTYDHTHIVNGHFPCTLGSSGIARNFIGGAYMRPEWLKFETEPKSESGRGILEEGASSQLPTS